jgi:hypothetical protein
MVECAHRSHTASSSIVNTSGSGSIAVLSCGRRRGCWDGRANGQFVLDTFYRSPEEYVGLDAALNQIEGMDHGGMIAMEMLADGGESLFGQLSTEIHSDLPREGDALLTRFDLEVFETQPKTFGHKVANVSKGGSALDARDLG